MFSASVLGRSSPARPVMFVMLGAAAAALVAAVIVVLVYLWSTVHALSAPFAPSEASGHIEDAASLADAELPAIAGLDPALLSAMRHASAAAGAEGVAFEVTSGWRSRAYQQWLLDDAIVEYGSEQIARQFVATPDRSRHVTGHAIDIGGLYAQSWLIQHGAMWGICQVYANERWHFELAAEPGGVCPELLPDAEG